MSCYGRDCLFALWAIVESKFVELQLEQKTVHLCPPFIQKRDGKVVNFKSSFVWFSVHENRGKWNFEKQFINNFWLEKINQFLTQCFL